jgi:hypothetical protein
VDLFRHNCRIKGKKNHQFFSASTSTLITIYNNNIKQPISKFTEPLQDTAQKPLPADANPDGEVYLLASKQNLRNIFTLKSYFGFYVFFILWVEETCSI